MSGFSSFLKQKAAAALAPSATPTPPAAAGAPAAPVAASSKFSVPSFSGFSLPGITLPSIGLGLIPTGIDSTHNNTPFPTLPIYPKVAGTDNPNYTVEHASLIGAMHFPKTWAGGLNKKPVILVPGTGAYGGTNFRNNFTKLLTDTSWADPMWLNIPGAMCDESPKNAEYVAYAINYVGLGTGKPVTLIAWSQGNLACQWSLKYWPNTRQLVNNLISISADFHGTLTAYFPLPNSPAILSQQYTSNFINTLRANGGDSAYVPTTSIYSSVLDEIVQPQAGDGASAFMKDARGVGVLNVDLQQTCPLTPAGLLYGHAGVLYNAVAWALAKDAIQNGGPGRLDRIDLPTVSMQPWAPGLTLLDVDMTLGLIPVAGANIVKFFPKYIVEAALPAYVAVEAATVPPAAPLTAEQQAIVAQSKAQAGDTAQPAVIDPNLTAAAALGQSAAAVPPVAAATS
jgi:hypothetical protein